MYVYSLILILLSCYGLRNIAILVRKSATSAQYLKCVSPPIAKFSPPAAGQEQSKSGMCQLVLQYVPYEVKILLQFIIACLSLTVCYIDRP